MIINNLIPPCRCECASKCVEGGSVDEHTR
jgi:hypothetical protein